MGENIEVLRAAYEAFGRGTCRLAAPDHAGLVAVTRPIADRALPRPRVPASPHASPASRTLSDEGARISPRLSATVASAHHDSAAARVGKVLRMRARSRPLPTLAW